jgi:hypothetical protein
VKKIILKLEHCYGIRKLETVLDYSRSPSVAIYAPNGAMKSSLATTFQDIADGSKSRDRIFDNRKNCREITDERGIDLPAECVLVLRPYEEASKESGETATLLMNHSLREEYEALHSETTAAKLAFINAVKAQAKTKRDVEREISQTFNVAQEKFIDALEKLRDELELMDGTPFSDVPYDIVMDEKVQAFLETGDFRTAINSYVKKYNELVIASKYFKKDSFNYYNASNVAKQLKDNGFFKAKHTISLKGSEALEIESEEQLQDLIKAEKQKITEDVELRKKFDDLEKQIKKNTTLRDFENYIQNHEELLPELADFASFKKLVWKSYIKSNSEAYLALLDKVKETAVRTAEILTEAAQEKTLWQTVIEIFNDRFTVPFDLEVVNKVQVMLGLEPVPRLGFIFKDQGDECRVERAALLQTLSTGEKKAFYLLNILFDIEVRRQRGNETLLVIDDIADSFDYKNKYAIVQYLSELSSDGNFKQLILTHNFDFFRTIESRKLVQRYNCFMVSKTANGVELKQAVGIKNVFVKLWKPEFYNDMKMKICCIPFMRNLIEYTKGESDPDYIGLTSLLHWKKNSMDVKITDLDAIYLRLFSTAGTSKNGAHSIINLIHDEADACLLAADGINFENKVVLAMAIRLLAERFMVEKINDVAWWTAIEANQTPELLTRFCSDYSKDLSTIRTLQKVMLMTPENIHLNSFMYEPILDMSDQHLRRLYSEVKALI